VNVRRQAIHTNANLLRGLHECNPAVERKLQNDNLKKGRSQSIQIAEDKQESDGSFRCWL
jgi:hypothetical protein